MAAEEKQKSKGSDAYSITPNAMRHGYNSKVDGRHFVIDYQRDFRGHQISPDASVCMLLETPSGVKYAPQNPPCYELRGLTDRQIYELAHAQVIQIKKSQREEFKAIKERLFPKIEEE